MAKPACAAVGVAAAVTRSMEIRPRRTSLRAPRPRKAPPKSVRIHVIVFANRDIWMRALSSRSVRQNAVISADRAAEVTGPAPAAAMAAIIGGALILDLHPPFGSGV